MADHPNTPVMQTGLTPHHTANEMAHLMGEIRSKQLDENPLAPGMPRRHDVRMEVNKRLDLAAANLGHLATTNPPHLATSSMDTSSPEPVVRATRPTVKLDTLINVLVYGGAAVAAFTLWRVISRFLDRVVPPTPQAAIAAQTATVAQMAQEAVAQTSNAAATASRTLPPLSEAAQAMLAKYNIPS